MMLNTGAVVIMLALVTSMLNWVTATVTQPAILLEIPVGILD